MTGDEETRGETVVDDAAQTAAPPGGVGFAPTVSPDLPSPAWRAALALLRQLPQAGLSRAFGRIADMRIPVPMRRAVLGSFASAVGIDLSEADRELTEYESLDDFFVRALEPGARSWPDDPATAGSPVDGTIGQLGTVERGRVVQAKGRDYSIAALLGSEGEAEQYEGGTFLTLYLSPKDYHRVHAPTGGTIARVRHVPGALLPVNAAAVAHVEDLFPRNERVLCYLDGPLGRLAVVAIGAYNVGRITTTFDPAWGEACGVTNRQGRATAEERNYEPPVRVERGDEIMAFHLGSTVVLLLEPGRARLRSDVRPGGSIRLGQPLADAVRR
jgi:phosphatidylserine decarboxylase